MPRARIQPTEAQMKLAGLVDEINVESDGVCWTRDVADRLGVSTHVAYERLARLEARGLLKKDTVQGVDQTGAIRCYWYTPGDLING